MMHKGREPRMSIRLNPRLLLLLLLLSVWAISLSQLAVYPPVHEDEPWIASTGWQLATRGVFGSPLFAGLWQMDTRYYDFLPLYPLVSAVIFRGAGVGLFQARFVSVALGILVLALTFALGKRLWNGTVGLVAALMLVVLPLTLPPYSTGSLFLDLTRMARYDILVPVCGLGALLVYLDASRSQVWLKFALAGLLTGLAGLAHIYGAFWLPALLALAMYDKAKWKNILALVIGCLAPWSVYAFYVAGGWQSFRAQTNWYGERFEIFNLSWYVNNALHEISRYHFNGALTAVITRLLLVSAIVALAYATGRSPRSSAARVGLPLLVLVACLTVLIENKVSNYLILIAPLFALAVAFLVQTLAGRMQSGAQFLTPVVVGICIVLLGVRALNLNAAAAATTPYQTIAANLRTGIAPPLRVLGLHAYWFGMENVDLRDWIVPLQWSMPQPDAPAMTMTAALNQLAPDVIIIDPRMREYFSTARDDPRPAQVTAWLRANAFTCALQFTDATYGAFQIFKRADSAASGKSPASCPMP